jgi:hypothetical protein
MVGVLQGIPAGREALRAVQDQLGLEGCLRIASLASSSRSFFSSRLAASLLPSSPAS